MFKNITINLTGPICKCEEQELAWAISVDTHGHHPGLEVSCTSCKTILKIPSKEFKAGWKLDVPYPGKPVKKKTADLTVLDGGAKVISIEEHKPDSENSQ